MQSTLMNKLIAVLKLTRAEHSLMLMVAVLAAEMLASPSFTLPRGMVLILSLITPVFISMASFAINDYFDVEADRYNKKVDRPLVSGALHKRDALTLSLLFLGVGVVASYFINGDAFAIAAVFGFLAFMYSYKLKDMPLLGNAYIAFSMVIPFIYGNFIVSSTLVQNVIVISTIVFVSGLAREIHGMVRDHAGDAKARGTRNIVHYLGVRRSSKIALVLYVEAIAASVYMFFLDKPFAYNLLYLVPILIVDAMLIYVSMGYAIGKKSERFHTLSRNLSLGAMTCALLVYLLVPALYSIGLVIPL